MSEEVKIGVYICHCGINIAGVVNPEELVEYASTLPNVSVSKDYKFMCSSVGQEMIKEDIAEGKVNRVVVAACSPRMHEPTFRLVLKEAGVNEFLFEQANIREHATWVNMEDPSGAKEIAKDHIRMAVAKVNSLVPLEVERVKVEPSCLLISAPDEQQD